MVKLTLANPVKKLSGIGFHLLAAILLHPENQ